MKFCVNDIPSLEGKTYLVTGGNTGIGYETCLALSNKGATVYLAARSEERGQAAISKLREASKEAKIHFLQLDLADLEQIKKAANEFLSKDIPLDCLINNAGIMACPFALTKNGIESQFATNHVGHFLLTELLMPALLKSEQARIVNTSSVGHNMAPRPEGIRFKTMNEEKGMGPWERYGQSKLANILFSHGLHKRYFDKGILSNSAHPGFVDTELLRGPNETYGKIASRLMTGLSSLFFMSPATGALTQLFVATHPSIAEAKVSGKYFVPIAKQTEPGLKVATDDNLADELWHFTENLVKDFK